MFHAFRALAGGGGASYGEAPSPRNVKSAMTEGGVRTVSRIGGAKEAAVRSHC